MRVKKILNNNIAIVEKGGHESIVYSTGISFKKKKLANKLQIPKLKRRMY
ncbi:CAT RNA binding domain-containing protein [Lacrimispora celerecrescens]